MKNFSVALLFCLAANGASAFVASTAPIHPRSKSHHAMKMVEETTGVALAFQDKLSIYPTRSLATTNSVQLTTLHREQQRVPNARQISNMLPPSGNTPSKDQLATRRLSAAEQAEIASGMHNQDMLSPYPKLSLSNTDSQTISGCIRRGGRSRARG